MKKLYHGSLVGLLFLTLVFWGCAKKTVHFSSPSADTGTSSLSQLPPSPSLTDLFSDKEEGLSEERVEEEGLLAQQIARDFASQPFPVAEKMGKEGSASSSPLQNVYFDFDRATLTEDAKTTLVRNAAWLKDHSDAKVQIEGHADERGTSEYNLALGDRRAQAVKTYLTTLGVHPSRLAIISYGEERPIDPGHNEAAWAKNRRAAFNLLQGVSRR